MTTCYNVRLTTDKDEIYAFLRRDPVFAAYAIGDLEDELFAACTWRLAEAGETPAALALLYTRLEPPVLLTIGQPAAVTAILAQMELPKLVYMNAQVDHLPAFAAHYDFSADRVRPMLRMAVTAADFRPAAALDSGGAALSLRWLGPAEAPAIEALVARGGPFAPDAFSPAQLETGLFVGVELQPAAGLIAVAGTHLVAPTWGVAAVGNIYTHPAHRGRGYGRLVSSAVTAELLRRGLLVVLNVDQANTAAIRIYEALGYRVHCPFVEGIGKHVKRET